MITTDAVTRDAILDYFTKHPGGVFTVRQIADALGLDYKLVSNRTYNMKDLVKTKVGNQLTYRLADTPAPEGAEEHSDAAQVRTSAARAQVLAYLANHPGEHGTVELSKTLGWTVKRARDRLPKMAAQGLIAVRVEGNTRVYSARPTSDSHGEYIPAAQRETKTRKYKPKLNAVEAVAMPASAHTPAALEIVGHPDVVVVIDRNPITGRMRITLEKGV